MNYKKILKDIVETVVIAIVLSFVLTNYLIVPCRVDGSSMYSTLKENQLGYSFAYKKYFNVNRFDIAVIKTSGKLIVKRVIGLPNETVTYTDNKLYIDGKYIEEEFLDDVYTADFSITLNDDEYYCLGDNREISKDSRYYGPFSLKDIKSLGFIVIYPFNEFGVKQ